MRAMTLARIIPVMLALVPLPHTARAGGVVNNVMLEWRTLTDRCDDTPYMDDMALVQVAMFEAINAIAKKYTPYTGVIAAPPGSSESAAAASAAHDILVVTCADQKTQFDSALKHSLGLVTDSVARNNGAEVGRKAAAAILAARKDSKSSGRDPVFSAPTAGVYVPTIRQVGMIWARMTPWVMRKPDELRPPAPPALTSESFQRDFNEIKKLGAKKSEARSGEQSDIGKFWANRDVRLVLRQLVGLPGRSLVDDARFLALAEMAWADSYVAMMDGKYAYNYWRPVTAIRGATMMKNESMVADAEWEAVVNTPPHPEYPCGHCLSAAAVGSVIEAEFRGEMPNIVIDQDSTMLRRYITAQEYIDEVGEARILAGVHYRNSVNVGKKMGMDIGKLATERYFKPLRRNNSL